MPKRKKQKEPEQRTILMTDYELPTRRMTFVGGYRVQDLPAHGVSLGVYITEVHFIDDHFVVEGYHITGIRHDEGEAFDLAYKLVSEKAECWRRAHLVRMSEEKCIIVDQTSKDKQSQLESATQED